LIGSGVVVGFVDRKAIIATAAHVVMRGPDDKEAEGKSWTLRSSLGGPGWTARLVIANPGADIAVLVGEYPAGFPRPAAAFIAPAKSYLFRKMVAYGHPLGVTRGHLTEGRISDEGPDGYRASAPVFFGNSGGGAYVEVDGRWQLFGLVVTLAGTNGGMYLAPHIAGITSRDVLVNMISAGIRQVLK
jgi:hypothetical protein